jgi:hypothetical protein
MDLHPRKERMMSVLGFGRTSLFNDIEQTITGKGGLSYNASTGRYDYAWATSSSWSGCRQFVMKLKDGSVQRANFIFR